MDDMIVNDNRDICAVMELIDVQSINLMKNRRLAVALRVVVYGFLLVLFLVTFPLCF